MSKVQLIAKMNKVRWLKKKEENGVLGLDGEVGVQYKTNKGNTSVCLEKIL